MLSSCGPAERYWPTDGNVEYYKNIVNDDTAIEMRIRGENSSACGSACYLDIEIEDSVTPIKELLIYSIIVKDVSSKEEIIVHSEKDDALRISLIRGQNGVGDVSYWPHPGSSLGKKTFQPSGNKNEEFDVIIDISIVPLNVTRKTLTFSFSSDEKYDFFKEWANKNDDGFTSTDYTYFFFYANFLLMPVIFVWFMLHLVQSKKNRQERIKKEGLLKRILLILLILASVVLLHAICASRFLGIPSFFSGWWITPIFGGIGLLFPYYVPFYLGLPIFISAFLGMASYIIKPTKFTLLLSILSVYTWSMLGYWIALMSI